MAWPAFWVEETGDCERSLRAFTYGQYLGAVPGDGYYDNRPTHAACPAQPRRPVKGQPHIQYQSGHDGVVDIGQARLIRSPEGFIAAIPLDEYEGDPRWPTKCDHCGDAMPAGAMRQVNQEPIYAEVHHGDGVARAWQQSDLPAGAMFDATWHPRKGPDGIALAVVLPGKPDDSQVVWIVDGEAGSGGHWTRTGDPKANPPTVSAQPSILVKGQYHGYLTNGVLVDDIDGNTF